MNVKGDMDLKLRLEYPSGTNYGLENPVIVLVNNISYLVLFTSTGLVVANTGYPQLLVDYHHTSNKDCAKIIGIDMI